MIKGLNLTDFSKKTKKSVPFYLDQRAKLVSSASLALTH